MRRKEERKGDVKRKWNKKVGEEKIGNMEKRGYRKYQEKIKQRRKQKNKEMREIEEEEGR